MFTDSSHHTETHSPKFSAHCTLNAVMRTLAAIGAFVMAFTFSGSAAAQPFSPPPDLASLRGKPAIDHEQLQRRNEDALYRWREELNLEQRTNWFAAMGLADPEAKERGRFGTQSLPNARNGYDWSTVARFAGLNDAEIAQLARDKLLLEDVALQQAFEAYTEPRRPVFITSDSVLNAFHVLFEDSFRELELRRAFALRVHLEKLVLKARELIADPKNEFSPAELQSGWHHAQLVVGPALRLLGTPGEFFDAETRAEIERQIALLRASAAVELPPWLGPATARFVAIDYRRCRPIGFYTSTPSLQNYFRAVRWLQSVPFRAERDDELTAIALLGYAGSREFELEQFLGNYTTFAGRTDDRSMPEASHDFQNLLSRRRATKNWQEQLVFTRAWVAWSNASSIDWKKLDDTLRLPPELEGQLDQIEYRVLAATRLPDSIVLARLGEPGNLPSGLAVAALLGSVFARRQLEGDIAPEKLEAALAEAREDWHPTNDEAAYRRPILYERYLDALAALNEPAERDAPEFMRSEAWAAKSCLTTLASWAQMRHTFTLQAKNHANFLGLVRVPPGFVEPNPEFFRRVADLSEEAEAAFDHSETFLPSAHVAAERYRQAAEDLESLGLHLTGASAKTRDAFTDEQQRLYSRAVGVADGEVPQAHATIYFDDHATDADFQQAHADFIAQFRSQAEDLSSGKNHPPPARSVLHERWSTLKSLARRLEALAHKQLRRQPWTSAEEGFIRGYGASLARVHGYFGNSWLVPRDDAPRWASVMRDPTNDTQLAVAIGRPRLIHVLYPYGDSEILCAGAVMSYYEYPASGPALTDDEWTAQLDSSPAPALPKWLDPYFAR